MEIVEINPTDKAEEIKTLLMGLNSEVKTSTDEGYTWLQDHSICVIAHNPTHEKMLEIELEEQGKFSLFFGGHHCHYCADAEEYARLSDDIQAILENRLCAATICYGDKQWLGSRLVNEESIYAPYQKNFEFVLKHQEFSDKIKECGGVISYLFWDSNKDVQISI